jgi:small subunit ribosomal protein S6
VSTDGRAGRAGSLSRFADANALLPRIVRGRRVHRRRWVTCVTTSSWSSSTPTWRSGPSLPPSSTFLNVVRNGGGTVEKVDVWGRRRLSFEIDKKAEGIYAVVDLNAEPAVMKELDRQLNLNESILRTKVMRPDLRASKPAPAKAPKPAAAPPTPAPAAPAAS